MRCPSSDALIDYVAGGHQELGFHVKQCNECSSLVSLLRGFEAEWKPSIEGVELPAYLREKIRERFRAPQQEENDDEEQ